MKFTELLNKLAPPVGTLIKRNFAMMGLGDPDKLVVESPRKFMEKLALLYGGSIDAARLLIFLTGGSLREKGIIISPDEFLRAFERDDREFIVEWLETLDYLLKE
ncbi:MAG: hypothetical protein DRJ96_09925 [Thermoprotei archaeon]|nr:hypothetical protein [Thermoproteales archaeon]RLE93676.1 MAG: hypothetical protein DRJ96_09925 [Thermoprotei archaeon]